MNFMNLGNLPNFANMGLGANANELANLNDTAE